MKIAHLSDLHLVALDGAVPFRLFNKRITGYVNLRLRREAVHQRFAAQAAAREIRRLGVDHVVLTGDLTNLALEAEFELGLRFLAEDLGLPPERVSLVPGNHDAYTAGAHRSRRFARTFASYLRSDLAEPAVAGEAFPFVHLRGPAAIIGVSTALPRPPLLASGAVGRAQLEALARILVHPEVASRTVVVLQHHPIHDPASFVARVLQGLDDSREEARVLAGVRRGLLLHGHLHRRVHRRLPTDRGYLDAVGATSASLLHEDDVRMAGFNVYELGDDGAVRTIASRRMNRHDEEFVDAVVPRDA